MDVFNDVCLNCFKRKGEFDVCPHCGYVYTPPEQEYHLYPGTVLNGRYLVGTVIGFGGFGVTYKAWDLQLQSIVAIKEFFPAGLVNRVPGESQVLVFDGTDKENYREYLERFLDEARNLAQFNGRANIVNVFGSFEENNTAYYVMEYLDGISLKEYVEQNGKIPIDTALVIITSLLEGTSAVHSKGIIHRDIAPDNIILTNEGNVKMLDFGSARFSADSNEKTLSAFIKPGYAAPEQYAAKGEQGVWTDIYGLGATMYYMVTGVRLEEATDRMVNDTAARPSDLGIDLPAEVDKAIMKSIALQIDIRFKSTDEFLAALSGDYKIEYPDVEIKKKKRRRIILAGVSAASIIMAVGLSVFLYNKLQVNEYETILPDTQVEMWVYADNDEYDPGKSQLPESFKEIVSENKNEQFETQKTAYEDLESNFYDYINNEQKFSENLSVNIEVYDGKEEYKEALLEAAENNSLPDIFMVPDAAAYDGISEKCRDLSDFASIFTEADYKFISSGEYENLYPGKKLIPLGFSSPVLYINTALDNDYGINMEDTDFNTYTLFDDVNKNAGTEFKTSFSRGGLVKAKTFGVDGSAYGDFISLYGGSLSIADENGSITDDGKKITDWLKETYTANNFNPEAEVSDYFYYGQLAYMVGDISIFESVNNYVGGSYEMRPITMGGKPIVNLNEEIAVNAEIDENKALLARAFTEYLLSSYGQRFLNIVIGNSLPIYKEALDTYTANNSNYDSIFGTDGNYYENGSPYVIGEAGLKNAEAADILYQNCYKGDESADDVDLTADN